MAILNEENCTVKYIADTVALMEAKTNSTLPAPAVTTKGAATRWRIVATAADLFFGSGVSKTSLDDVCAASQTGKSQIYHYFDDKSALVRAVVQLQGQRILDEQRPYLSGPQSWDSWQQWRDSIVRRQELRYCIGGCPLGSIANELSDIDSHARTALAENFDEWESALRERISSMRALGLLRPDTDPETMATVMLAAVQGGLLLCKTRRTSGPLKVALDGAIALLRTHST